MARIRSVVATLRLPDDVLRLSGEEGGVVGAEDVLLGVPVLLDLNPEGEKKLVTMTLTTGNFPQSFHQKPRNVAADRGTG